MSLKQAIAPLSEQDIRTLLDMERNFSPNEEDYNEMPDHEAQEAAKRICAAVSEARANSN